MMVMLMGKEEPKNTEKKSAVINLPMAKSKEKRGR